jgi:K+-sensing histidine kinase KdpD
VHLYFAIKDTGKGLSEDEKTRLFHRFSQASPRTHVRNQSRLDCPQLFFTNIVQVQYGGSGLGLFISRELTELQGGEIGIKSSEDVGSMFIQYYKKVLETYEKQVHLHSTSKQENRLLRRNPTGFMFPHPVHLD